jgi:hypothetical protein
MATLADELANDFLDDGSDVENGEDGLEPETDGFTMPSPKRARTGDGDLEMSGNEDEDADMNEDGLLGEAQEETEARLERERKDAIPKDMRSVSLFMKSLEPVLEVSHP